MSKKVIIALGGHIVTGHAEDSFCSIEKLGDGTMSRSGCDGEVVRAIDPSNQRKIKITLLQTSESNDWLENMKEYDDESGEGVFPILIKNLTGREIFSAEFGWVVKFTVKNYGKDSVNREWEIDTADGTMRSGG